MNSRDRPICEIEVTEKEVIVQRGWRDELPRDDLLELKKFISVVADKIDGARGGPDGEGAFIFSAITAAVAEAFRAALRELES